MKNNEKLLTTVESFKSLAVEYLKKIQVATNALAACKDPDFEATEIEIAVAKREYELYRMIANDILKKLTGEAVLYQNTDIAQLIENVEKMKPFE